MQKTTRAAYKSFNELQRTILERRKELNAIQLFKFRLIF